jgi:hypothetical protein
VTSSSDGPLPARLPPWEGEATLARALEEPDDVGALLLLCRVWGRRAGAMPTEGHRRAVLALERGVLR